MLAARMGWRWLGIGQLLRDTYDPEIHRAMLEGKMIPTELSIKVMDEAIKKAAHIDELILDGFPRMLEQAQWLISSQPEHERAVKLAIVLEVPREELLKRLEIRGRADDTPEAIDARLNVYRKETYPILNLLTEHDIPVAHIDGVGAVGEIHDRIAKELTSRGLM